MTLWAKHNDVLNEIKLLHNFNLIEVKFKQCIHDPAFDRVNHQGILFKFCSVGVGGSVLYVLTEFLFNRSQYVVVDGCRNNLVNVVSGVPQGSVLDPLLFLLFKSRANAFLLAWSARSFFFCLLPLYLFLPSIYWLCGVGVFALIERFHSLPALHSGLQLIIIILLLF